MGSAFLVLVIEPQPHACQVGAVPLNYIPGPCKVLSETLSNIHVSEAANCLPISIVSFFLIKLCIIEGISAPIKNPELKSVPKCWQYSKGRNKRKEVLLRKFPGERHSPLACSSLACAF